MHATTFGPHRGHDWLSRVAFGGLGQHVRDERFVLRAFDPKHPRALWACLRLVSAADGVSAKAVCEVAYFDGVANQNWQAQEEWPLERTTLDPERGGLGVGECAMLTASSQGLVRGGDFAIAWQMAFAGGCGPQMLLPSAWLHNSRMLRHKAVAWQQGAKISQGHLEIWHSLGRAAERTRLDLAGWQVFGQHAWGNQALCPYAAIDAPTIEGCPGNLTAVTYGTTLAGLAAIAPQQGVLQLDGNRYDFKGFTALCRRTPADLDSKHWRLELHGPQGSLIGAVTANAAGTLVLPMAPGRQLLLAADAQLDAVFTPRNAPARPVRGQRVFFEALLPADQALTPSV